MQNTIVKKINNIELVFNEVWIGLVHEPKKVFPHNLTQVLSIICLRLFQYNLIDFVPLINDKITSLTDNIPMTSSLKSAFFYYEACFFLSYSYSVFSTVSSHYKDYVLDLLASLLTYWRDSNTISYQHEVNRPHFTCKRRRNFFTIITRRSVRSLCLSHLLREWQEFQIRPTVRAPLIQAIETFHGQRRRNYYLLPTWIARCLWGPTV